MLIVDRQKLRMLIVNRQRGRMLLADRQKWWMLMAFADDNDKTENPHEN